MTKMNPTPKTLTITMSDGTEHCFAFKAPKESKSGKLNAHAGGKLELEDGRAQVGCNVTVIG